MAKRPREPYKPTDPEYYLSAESPFRKPGPPGGPPAPPRPFQRGGRPMRAPPGRAADTPAGALLLSFADAPHAALAAVLHVCGVAGDVLPVRERQELWALARSLGLGPIHTTRDDTPFVAVEGGPKSRQVALNRLERALRATLGHEGLRKVDRSMLDALSCRVVPDWVRQVHTMAAAGHEEAVLYVANRIAVLKVSLAKAAAKRQLAMRRRVAEARAGRTGRTGE